MPVKRRIAKRRRETVVPDWVPRFFVGELPEWGTEAHGAYVGWLYFDEEVPGLPDVRSEEGTRLWCAARSACP